MKRKIQVQMGMVILCLLFFWGVVVSENTVYAATTVKNAYYSISSALNSREVLTIDAGSKANGANLQIWSNENVSHQIFAVERVQGQYYKIVSMNSKKALDIAEKSTASKANVQQWDYIVKSCNQLWRFIPAGNGYYYIQSKTGKYLDVSGGKGVNGANVWMYTLNRSKAQKWKLHRISNFIQISEDKKNIASVGGQTNITVNAIGKWTVSSSNTWISVTKKSNGIKILCSKNRGASRSGIVTIRSGNIFKTIKIFQESTATMLPSGTYSIATALNNREVLTIDAGKTSNYANLHLWSNENVNQQKFEITKVSGDYYKIIAIHSGKSLDIAERSKAAGANVQQWDYIEGSSNQLWKFKSAGNGYYYIQSKLGTYLDVAEGNGSNGANVWMYTGNKTNAQKWKLTKTTAYTSTAVKNGTYTISTALNSREVLTIDAGKEENGTNLQIWSNENVNHQKYEIINTYGEYYRIVAGHSGKVLDVAEKSKAAGANVQQWDYVAGSINQLWRFIPAGNGYYYIQSKLGTYLDIAGGNGSNGTNVWMYTGNKSAAQKWKLTPTVIDTSSNGIELNYSYMTSSKKQGDYSAFVVKGANIGCMATAYAIGYSIIDRVNYSPLKFWSGSGAYDPIGRCGRYINGFNALDIYNNLKEGKPVLLHYYYANNSGQHWVTIIGVKKGSNTNSLQANDFIVLDPASGSKKALTDSGKFGGGTIKGYQKF